MSRLIHPMPRVIWVEELCSAIIMFPDCLNLICCSFWNLNNFELYRLLPSGTWAIYKLLLKLELCTPFCFWRTKDSYNLLYFKLELYISSFLLQFERYNFIPSGTWAAYTLYFESRAVCALFPSEFWAVHTFCLLEKFELCTVYVPLVLLKLELNKIFSFWNLSRIHLFASEVWAV